MGNSGRNIFPREKTMFSLRVDRGAAASSGKAKNAAFSMIEFMVVLGIISLVLGLTTVYIFNFRAGRALRLSAQNLAAALNQARGLAITEQTRHAVAIDTAQSRYFIYRLPNDATREIVSRDFFTLSGVTINNTNFVVDIHASINLPAVRFNSTGSVAGANGSIVLSNTKGRTSTITVVNVTGRVRILN